MDIISRKNMHAKYAFKNKNNKHISKNIDIKVRKIY